MYTYIHIHTYRHTYIYITFITLKNCFINNSLENPKGVHHSYIHLNVIPSLDVSHCKPRGPSLLAAGVVVAVNGVWILVETYTLSSKMLPVGVTACDGRKVCFTPDLSPLGPRAGGFSWSRFVPWSYIVFLTSEWAACRLPLS